MNNNETKLEKISTEWNHQSGLLRKRIVVCAGTGCVANGSLKVYDKLLKKLEDSGIKVVVELDKHDCSDSTYVSKSGCQGFCQMGPLLTFFPENILYTKVKIEDVDEIVQKTILKGEIIDRLLYVDPATKKHCKGPENIPFYSQQKRIVLNGCGTLDPHDINEYIAHDGYKAARECFTKLKSEDICNEILRSGLRGRGGGGFLTGKKWDFARVVKSDKKYIICNGDEGDPGAFMDRSLMEGNPHKIIEGMMIAGKAIGADEGFVYVRMEYPFAVERIRKAVEDAQELGILGNDIFGSGSNFHVTVMEGAGAFVCGEETALMASVEGHRGMPTPKPPFPAQQGLFEKPTIINNVETLASVSGIILNGAKEFRKYGTESSPGTKTFALTGHVANTGLIEVPFGTTLREIIFNIGGGVTDTSGNLTGETFKAVQIGGPSGGCLTEKELDLPLDFDSLKKVGAMVGSGGLVVMNKDTCMVQIARFFMKFTQNESCGKCVPCREGTKQMLSLLDDIIEGRGERKTLEKLKRLGNVIQKASLCGLGKTAPSPVLSTMEKFYPEYLAHVDQKRCPTKNCKALLTPEIDPDKCVGCTACARKCPVGAISGEVKKPHVIDPEICIKCGACKSVCKFNAISGV